LPTIFNDFLVDRELRGCRPATMTFYREEVGIFLKWADLAGLHTLEELSSDTLRAFFINLGNRRNEASVHKNFEAIRTFLLWTWGEFELFGTCPIKKVKVAKPKEEPKPGVSLEDARQLVAACKGKRDRAILLFLQDTGVRRRELCVLNVGNLVIDTVPLSSDGTKTGKARVAFISLDTRKAIRAYFRERPDLKPEQPLFATKEGERFTVSGLRQVIRRFCLAAGIPAVGLHDFRRTFALESLRAGTDVVSVSRLLGHTSIETTKRYLAQVDDDLKAAHAKSSPVDTLLRRKKPAE
jgi:integrase/recombinase XerD